jgi:hypothetical protein
MTEPTTYIAVRRMGTEVVLTLPNPCEGLAEVNVTGTSMSNALAELSVLQAALEREQDEARRR